MGERKLRLTKDNKVLAGVCGGLGEYFKIDPTLVRVIFVALAFMSLGVTMAAVYILFWALIPAEI